MNLVARVALLAALNTALAVSASACSEDDWYSNLFMGVDVEATPTIVGPDGETITTTWSGNAVSGNDSFGTTLNAKNGMRLSLDFHNPQSPTTFTTFRLRKFDDIFGPDVPPGEMQIAFLDTAKQDVTSITGKVRVERLDAPKEERFQLKIVFEDLRMTTGSGGSTSTQSIVPLANDGGFVETDGGGMAFTGYTWNGSLETSGDSSMTKLNTSSSSSSGGSSTSSGSSSGGTSDCSKAWTCAYDQAASLCQQACTYENDSTKHGQVCKVLESMVETYPNSCCPGCR